MNLRHQIKFYRTSMGLSQDELAEQIYVSRQTISNWETGKNYPDVHSLVLMGNFFNVSLDELIKGDLEIMKNTVDSMNIRNFKQLSNVFSILMAMMVIAPVPLGYYLHWAGLVIYVIIVIVAMLVALQIEKLKKEYDIQTYKEILAFMNSTKLDKIVAEREKGKRLFQKIVIVSIFAIVSLLISLLFVFLFFKLNPYAFTCYFPYDKINPNFPVL